jgi:hypothetical protein
VTWSIRTVFAGAALSAAAVIAGLGGAGQALSAPAPYIHLKVTQARDSSGRTIASVWLDTNGGKPGPTPYTPVGWPLVYTQPWHTSCQADPRKPLPGGKSQLIYLWTLSNEGSLVHWQPVVRIPTARAQQITLCGYLVTQVSPPDVPFAVLATTRTSVAIEPPRGRSPMPLNQGPWRSCAIHNAPQVVRILANRSVANGCATATTIANTWVNQWHHNFEQWQMWEDGPAYYPTVVHTYSPIPALHRTLSCQATKVLPISDFQPEVVNCGLAVFKFNPGL